MKQKYFLESKILELLNPARQQKIPTVDFYGKISKIKELETDIIYLGISRTIAKNKEYQEWYGKILKTKR